jgi:hypothetical protein
MTPEEEAKEAIDTFFWEELREEGEEDNGPLGWMMRFYQGPDLDFDL